MITISYGSLISGACYVCQVELFILMNIYFDSSPLRFPNLFEISSRKIYFLSIIDTYPVTLSNV